MFLTITIGQPGLGDTDLAVHSRAGWRFGLSLGLASGLAAAGTFLAAAILQDLLGRRVGAPGAEKTATMLTVALLGNIFAAFLGGGAMGRIIFNKSRTPE